VSGVAPDATSTLTHSLLFPFRVNPFRVNPSLLVERGIGGEFFVLL